VSKAFNTKWSKLNTKFESFSSSDAFLLILRERGLEEKKISPMLMSDLRELFAIVDGDVKLFSELFKAGIRVEFGQKVFGKKNIVYRLSKAVFTRV